MIMNGGADDEQKLTFTARLFAMKPTIYCGKWWRTPFVTPSPKTVMGPL